MKRVFAVVAACVVLAGVKMSYGQCDDAYDANLCVYYVADADNQFARDGAVSAFWGSWAGKDYIEMAAPASCYPGRCNFTGADDASLNIKAAGTGRGLYVLSTVKDNTWVDRANADDWGADAMDIYFDAQSASTIFTCTDCLIGLYASTLSYYTQQFQVWMGASALPTGCRYAYYDENLWSWQTIGVDWAAAVVLYGFQVDVIQIDANTKAQEWFFPWEKYGQGFGLSVGTALAGKKLGFSGGYNDQDGDNTGSPDCLRWLLKDPWAEDAKTVNYWGDFELAADMPAVQSVVKVQPKNNLKVAAAAAKAGTSQYFNLRGQKINGSAMDNIRSSAVVVQHGVARSNVQVLGR